jgi:hypothetical protein
MAMHQANYIPWIGYFYKMAKCDIFVYLDVVQYPRGKSFSARNKIKTANGETFLSIPVSIPKGDQNKAIYSKIHLADRKWIKKHLKTLELNYKKAPYFNEVFDLILGQIYNYENLLELNISLIETFADYLAINSTRVRLSKLLDNFGQKTELIIDICEKLKTPIYLSGTGGGKTYNDETMLNKKGIELLYSDFQHPQYRQLWGTFVPNLSIIDLLFNEGHKSRDILLGAIA